MLMFQSAQKYLAVLGIEKYQKSRKYPFNERIIIIMNTFILACISGILYLNYSRESIDIQEYMIVAYTTFTTIINGIEYVILVWQSSKLFALIEDLESIVHDSEYKLYTSRKFLSKYGTIHIFRTKISRIEEDV